MKSIVMCGVSALLGIGIALALRQPLDHSRTDAAEPPPSIARVPLEGPQPALPKGFASVPAADAQLTPEELVNVAVYDNVNRSVVNINTKTVSADRFFFYEVPAEGAFPEGHFSPSEGPT